MNNVPIFNVFTIVYLFICTLAHYLLAHFHISTLAHYLFAH